MKNINRPEYDVNQIASFITENVDEINMPGEKPANPMPPRFAGKVNPDGTPRGMARTDLDTRKSLHQRRREYKAAQAAEGQTGQGLGNSGQYRYEKREGGANSSPSPTQETDPLKIV